MKALRPLRHSLLNYASNMSGDRIAPLKYLSKLEDVGNKLDNL